MTVVRSEAEIEKERATLRFENTATALRAKVVAQEMVKATGSSLNGHGKPLRRY